MKQVKVEKFEVGKYYMAYRRGNGHFKRLSIFMYEGVFTEPVWTHFNEYKYSIVRTSFNFEAPMYAGDLFMAYELDDDEIYRHITMEEITTNL